jgi:hypothetical protein
LSLTAGFARLLRRAAPDAMPARCAATFHAYLVGTLSILKYSGPEMRSPAVKNFFDAGLDYVLSLFIFSAKTEKED